MAMLKTLQCLYSQLCDSFSDFSDPTSTVLEISPFLLSFSLFSYTLLLWKPDLFFLSNILYPFILKLSKNHENILIVKYFKTYNRLHSCKHLDLSDDNLFVFTSILLFTLRKRYYWSSSFSQLSAISILIPDSYIFVRLYLEQHFIYKDFPLSLRITQLIASYDALYTAHGNDHIVS